MVTDQQVRRLMELIPREPTLCLAAAKAGMDEKTARKYRGLGQLPSEVQAPHTWRTPTRATYIRDRNRVVATIAAVADGDSYSTGAVVVGPALAADAFDTGPVVIRPCI